LDIIYKGIPQPKPKEKVVKVWLRVCLLCGKAKRTTHDTATTQTAILLSFFFIVGIPF